MASLCGVNIFHITSQSQYCELLFYSNSASAFMLFTGILVHIYMAFWVKGSIRGIVEGWVTVRWAKHHPR